MGRSAAAARLPVISDGQFLAEVKRGAQWVIIDNSVIDVTALQDERSGHKGGNVFNLGKDNTFLFHELHANLPVLPSKHRPELPSISAHILEKVQNNIVGILASRQNEVPLSDPSHRFWKPSQRKPPFTEQVATSLTATGVDAAAAIEELIGGLEPGSPTSRAFWAVVGCLTADAAAQPTHWNYKVTYYQDHLKQANRWETPEFITPSLNAYYRVPCGSHSCFGDQARVVLSSLVASGGRVDTSHLVQAHVQKFDERTEYGRLGRHDGIGAGDLPIDGPWRHGSIAGFLQNVKSGKRWPQTGTRDCSSDCFVKIVPVVAAYAGAPEMLDRVADVVKVTQNNNVTVAYASAAARVLEQIILYGHSGAEAVRGTAATMQRDRGGNGAAQIGGELEDIAELASSMAYLDSVIAFCGGRYNAVTVS
eukprot:gnl/TRDRNA2_/TRDRNA2_39110_c0_seq2.p1 gnl/TRDRNA2_/TRDRNA2_39110_c0~~gnl/TRDRNA2_/TRDRNA2_39110_c0_seq2.p1  ORF type:complete len:422 (+),score=70.71 gnl/TRDRNA2_/TRDRNA2_39110_c0_seq2:75-1340(+)